MKITGLMLLGLLALNASAAPAQTNQSWTIYRYPIRAFANRSVNLTPLFQWWERQPTNADASIDAGIPPDRPMTPWYHITGTKVAATGASWLVNAEIYTSPTLHTNERIFLNHPPVEEEAAFYDWTTQLPALDQQIAQLQKGYNADTNAERKAEERVAEYRRSRSKVAPTGIVEYSRAAETDHNAAAGRLDQLDQLKTARAQMAAQLKTIPAIRGQYRVDWFAIELGRTKQGVRIFDLGLLSGNP